MAKKSKLDFAFEFRNRFINLANHYQSTYDDWSRSGEIIDEEYTWLTKNVELMQSSIGGYGVVDYIAPFNRYRFPRYQILINTLPKFRERIDSTDINMSDDCLLRYIGVLENILIRIKKELGNPFIWFKEGIAIVMILPLNILHWLGLINNTKVKSVENNSVYKFTTGFIALITLVSGIVTILQGKDVVVTFIKSLLEV